MNETIKKTTVEEHSIVPQMVDPKSLADDLRQLERFIKEFDDEELGDGIQIEGRIQELSERKGNILGIKYSKEPTTKELLDVNRDIVKQTNSALQRTNDRISDLHDTDAKIFKLLCILAGLSGMTYKRIKEAFDVIDDAQKNIDGNCNVTSEQGQRIKQIALMHLQRIQEDKARYEELDAFVRKYTSEIDTLVRLFGDLDNHIANKQSEWDEHVEEQRLSVGNSIDERLKAVKTELDKVQEEALHQLAQKQTEGLSELNRFHSGVIKELSDKQSEVMEQAGEASKQASELLEATADARKQMDLYLKEYKASLEKTYRKRYWTMGIVVVLLSAIISVVISFLL